MHQPTASASRWARGRPDIISLVVWQGMELAAIGIVAGLAGAAVLTRVLAGLPQKTRPGLDKIIRTALQSRTQGLIWSSASALDPLQLFGNPYLPGAKLHLNEPGGICFRLIR